MQNSLSPLDRPDLLHLTVQDRLKSYITKNNLVPGDPLPGEADLALRLGVSRSSVREAMRGLESVGIVETRRGVGAFVRKFSFEPLIDNLAFGLRRELRDIEELVEIRRALETSLVAQVLRRITRRDIDALRAVTNAMHAAATNGCSLADDDRNFHRTLFLCLDNKTLLQLLDVFWLTFSKVSRDTAMEDRNPMLTWQAHEEIVTALEARDLGATRRCLSEHYDGILDTLRSTLDRSERGL